jgi:hypothetical protein
LRPGFGSFTQPDEARLQFLIISRMKKNIIYLILIGFMLSLFGVTSAQQSEPQKIIVYSTSVVKKNAQHPWHAGMAFAMGYMKAAISLVGIENIKD